jgi:hypothetical protein
MAVAEAGESARLRSGELAEESNGIGIEIDTG